MKLLFGILATLLVLSALSTGAALGIGPLQLRSEPKPSVWISALGVTGDLSRSPSDLVVKIKKKKMKQGDTTQGERSCPAGYVVLEKPNRYGALCERKEGLPEPKKEAETCKFGTVGTYPNCECPPGSDFLGPSRGCVHLIKTESCYVADASWTPDWDRLKASCESRRGFYTCHPAAGENKQECCCEEAKYAD